MNRLLIFAIFDNQHLAAHAQGQTPNAAELAQKKVVSIIGGDKAKTQTYCQSWPRPLQRCRGLLFRRTLPRANPKSFTWMRRNRPAHDEESSQWPKTIQMCGCKGGLIMTIIEISDERSRALLKNREGTSDQRKAVELDEVLLGILHRLDDGTSERKVAYDHLLAIENEMKRRGSRGGFAAIWSRFVSVL